VVQLETSDSGLFHHLGKVACRKASGVRISPSPPKSFTIFSRETEQSKALCGDSNGLAVYERSSACRESGA
jgi:hypothetical protein